MTLSVTLWAMNSLISLPPCIWLGPKIDFSSYLSHLTRYWFENLNMGLQLKIRIKYINFKNSAKGHGWIPTMLIFATGYFLHRLKQIWIFNVKLSIKFWSALIWLVGRHALNQNGPPHGALSTLDVNLSIKYTLFDFELYMKMLTKFKIGPFWANWQTLSLFEMACIVGPQIHELAFFLKTDSLSIWILYWKC